MQVNSLILVGNVPMLETYVTDADTDVHVNIKSKTAKTKH